jgi:hypothetical protein
MQWIFTCQNNWKIAWSVPASHVQQWPEGVVCELQGLAKESRYTGMTWTNVALSISTRQTLIRTSGGSLSSMQAVWDGCPDECGFAASTLPLPFTFRPLVQLSQASAGLAALLQQSPSVQDGKRKNRQKKGKGKTVPERFLTCKSSSRKLGLRLLAVSALRGFWGVKLRRKKNTAQYTNRHLPPALLCPPHVRNELDEALQCDASQAAGGGRAHQLPRSRDDGQVGGGALLHLPLAVHEQRLHRGTSIGGRERHRGTGWVRRQARAWLAGVRVGAWHEVGPACSVERAGELNTTSE